MNHRLRKLNNRGSGLVTVLIAVLLLAAMGSLVLMLSCSSLEMQVSRRRGGETFYDAEGLVQQIQAGLQTVVSDSIRQACREALPEYSFRAGGISDRFEEAYRDAVTGWQNAEGIALFPSPGSYDASVLAAMVQAEGGSFTVTGLDPLTGLSGELGCCDLQADAITLRDITVVFTSDTGYTGTIETDIVLGVPDISYALSRYSVSGLPDFALIAGGSLTQLSTGLDPAVLCGNAYTDSMALYGTGCLQAAGGSLICRHTISVSGSGLSLLEPSRLITESSASLWADTIQVGTASGVSLLGNTYLANDLNLAGTGASAVLEGSYYGFGSSRTDSSASSSILANGAGSSLNLTGLSRLTLAGTAFIGDAAGTQNVMMGESISVKPDQEAYLIPTDCLIAEGSDGEEAVESNPELTDPGSSRTVRLNTEKELWNGKTFADYGISLRQSAMTISGQTLVYYFMKFDSPALASAYFRDYFEADPAAIEDNLSRYLQISGRAAELQSAGGTFSSEEEELCFTAAINTAGLDETAAGLQTMFVNLCRTLTTAELPSSAGSPYEYLVNTSRLAALGSPCLFYDGSGNAAALAVNGSYNWTEAEQNSYPGLCLILASGDVTVSADFSGLILCGGNVNWTSGSLCSDSTAVRAACSAAAADGSTILNLLNIDLDTDSSDSVGGSWDLSGLVTTQNWQKK